MTCSACAWLFCFSQASLSCWVRKCWPHTCHFMQWPTGCSSFIIMQGKVLLWAVQEFVYLDEANSTWKGGKWAWQAGLMTTKEQNSPEHFAQGLSKRCTSPQHSRYEQPELAHSLPIHFFLKHLKGYQCGFATQWPAFAAFFSSSLTKHMCIQTLFSPRISFLEHVHIVKCLQCNVKIEVPVWDAARHSRTEVLPPAPQCLLALWRITCI